jgi:hypothetical protein
MTLKPVLERVRELQAELAQAILVDAAALHRDWSEMWRADIAAIIEEQTGAYKPIHQWPAIWRRMLCHLDVRSFCCGPQAALCYYRLGSVR